MAIAQGFGKTASTGLIFGYDTGDMDNSFKGAPKTNLLSYYSRSYGNQSSSVFKTQYYTREVFVPMLGTRSVETMETYNDYGGGSGVCCQGAWHFGGSGVSGNTQYTYSIIYRSSSGYTHPNFMYRYEYGASGYITEGGLHNDGNRTHLGDGWYHAWGNMTTQPGTTTMYFYFYMYEYATYNTIDIAGVMFTQGPEIIRPRQFIPFSTTRSATQGLLDLAGLNSVNSQASYNSTGQLIFDGTDDMLVVSPNQTFSLNNYAMEVVVSATSLPGKRHYLIDPRGNGGESNSPMYFLFDDNGSQINIIGGNSNIEVSSGYRSIQTNQFYHIVCTRIGSTCKLYLNGSEVGSGNTGSSQLTITNPFRVGTYAAASSGQYFLNGRLGVAKMYSTGLTAAQVLQNYNHYKTRFNL